MHTADSGSTSFDSLPSIKLTIEKKFGSEKNSFAAGTVRAIYFKSDFEFKGQINFKIEASK